MMIWLFMAVPYPFFAASNAMLVLTVGSLGYLVGSRAGQLGVWSGGILVPRYTRSLFALCVLGVVLPTLLAGLACLWLGNPLPAVAPAMLVGAATTRYAIRRGLDPSAIMIWWLILLFVVGISAGARSHFIQAASVLSNVWVQLACAAAAGLIAPGLCRELVRPTARIEAVVLSSGGLGEFSLRDLRLGSSIAAGQLGAIVLIWYFIPKTAGQIFPSLWFVSLAAVLFSWWETTVHTQLSRDWVLGVARDRTDLGRRTAARAVWMSLPWLVLGTAWSGIHALVTDGEEAFFLKEVLLAHIAALLFATSLCHLTRRLPPSFSCRWGVFLLLMMVLGGGCGYFASQDYDAGDNAVLLLVLIGAAVLTVLLGGRALAQAELTEVSTIPGWRKRKR